MEPSPKGLKQNFVIAMPYTCNLHSKTLKGLQYANYVIPSPAGLKLLFCLMPNSKGSICIVKFYVNPNFYEP